jgi:hypothetical protein
VNVTASRPQHATASPDRDDEVLASAVLRLAPGVPFEPIARSAASLAAAQLLVPLQNIEILSASGNQRWRYDRDREAGGGSAEFLRLQRSLGEERTQLAQQRLDQLWPGKTSIAVNLELDPTWETKTEKVLPEEAIVKSETRDSTDASGGSTPNGERSTGKSTKREREFVTDIGERRTGKMAPEIKRLTVALLYDRRRSSAGTPRATGRRRSARWQVTSRRSTPRRWPVRRRVSRRCSCDGDRRSGRSSVCSPPPCCCVDCSAG